MFQVCAGKILTKQIIFLQHKTIFISRPAYQANIFMKRKKELNKQIDQKFEVKLK